MPWIGLGDIPPRVRSAERRSHEILSPSLACIARNQFGTPSAERRKGKPVIRPLKKNDYRTYYIDLMVQCFVADAHSAVAATMQGSGVKWRAGTIHSAPARRSAG